MSKEYDLYLKQHRSNVDKGFRWIKKNCPELMPPIHKDKLECARQISFKHDESKDQPDEYNAYDAYFYGKNKSYQVVQDYNYAWLLHLHRNPHHWQYWVLINDDPKEGEVILDMPYKYILEMVCDWWAFSWQKENLYAIFDWYDEHSKYMKLSTKTRKTVDNILMKIHVALDKERIREE